MPIKTHTCFSVDCDVCDAPLEDFEDSTMHFVNEQQARESARHYRWTVLSDGRFVCNFDDADHQAAMDELLPPEPVSQVPGQIAIDGEVSK
jgi:hypothetical protein